MAKKKKPPIFLWVLGIVSTFALVIILAEGNTIAQFDQFDSNGNLINSESLVETYVGKSIQSFFRIEEDLSSILLQSSVPATDSNSEAKFTVNVENPYNTETYVDNVVILKNSVQVDKIPIGRILEPSQGFTYTTRELDIIGIDGLRNNINLKFTMENEGNVFEKDFTFYYFSLTLCESDAQCVGENNKCDVGNTAGFGGISGDHYCTKGCVSTSQCAEGQICKLGVCGY